MRLLFQGGQQTASFTAERFRIVKLKTVLQKLENANDWTEESLEKELRVVAEELGVSFGKVAQLLRNILTGKKITPSIFDMLVSFGRNESLRGIQVVLS